MTHGGGSGILTHQLGCVFRVEGWHIYIYIYDLSGLGKNPSTLRGPCFLSRFVSHIVIHVDPHNLSGPPSGSGTGTVCLLQWLS